MKPDYNKISQKYDDVRSADLEFIRILIEEQEINENTKILDFGGGTGNYADKLQKLTGAKVFGVEPAEGMLEKARAKNPQVEFFPGNHEKVPFEDNFFDLIYMTDVIHHVPDIKAMFKELTRVLKRQGKICIATQSHDQIERRFYARYFPTTVEVDKARYPDIEEIIAAGGEYLENFKTTIYSENQPILVGAEFLHLVERKGYSMFHLIEDKEYLEGLKKLKNDIQDGEIEQKTAGGTLVWFEKN